MNNPTRCFAALASIFLINASDAKNPDFGGNGIVDFDDFFLFVDVFGQEVNGINDRYDLTSDGIINFDDFFAFVDHFGEEVSTIPNVEIANIISPDTEIAVVMTSEDSEKITVLAKKDQEGNATQITGATYITPEGNSTTIQIRNDGLPKSATSEGWVFHFSNYTDSTVDVLMTAPDGTVTQQVGVEIDADKLAELKLLGVRIGSALSLTPIARAKLVQAESDLTSSDMLKIASLSMDIACCAIGIATTPTGFGAIAVGACCASAVLGVAGELTDNELIQGAGAAVSAFNCVGSFINLGALKECASVGLEVIAGIIDEAEEFQSTQEIVIELPGGATMDFIWIGAGQYEMGTSQAEIDDLAAWYGRQFPNRSLASPPFSDEGPIHDVIISRGFYIGKYEVTREQWASVMDPNSLGDLGDESKMPVASVSYDDIHNYVNRLNESYSDSLFRLPTEAEWEYFARAGTESLWFFGDDGEQLSEYGWYNQPSAQTVGELQPNPWGLYDIYGNLFEWCLDYGSIYSPEAQVDPLIPPIAFGLPIVRGGNFKERYPELVRSANRGSYFESGDSHIGFRLIRMVKSAE